MPAGAPRKYRDDWPKKVNQYVKAMVSEKKTPLIKSLVPILGVSLETINVYDSGDDRKPEFSEALSRLRAIQHEMLVHCGLDSSYNSVIAKLLLQCNHGYTDKHDITTGGQSLADIAAIMGISSDEE